MQGYSGTIYEDNIYVGREDLSVPYFINCCGYLKANGIDVSLNRCRKDFYLIYLINGAGHYKLGQEYISVEAGNIILYKAGEKQDYYYVGNESSEIYWIHFTGSEAGNLLQALSLTGRNIYRTGIDSDCISIFESIIHEIQIKKPNYHQLCIGYLLLLLSTFSRKAAFLEKGEGALKTGYIENVIKLMHSDYQQWCEIEYYARMCNLSVYQFIRNFKRVTHFTPAKYIEKIRINKAKELLVNTGLTVDEISRMVGYNDAFYFSKVFKKVTSLTPTSYRTATFSSVYDA